LREALDSLNSAIAIAPAYPQSFTNRAAVFEQMGMLPQAEADRRRAQELAGGAGEPAPEPPPAGEPPGGRFPQRPPRTKEARRGPLVPSGLLIALSGLMVLALAGAGVAYAIASLDLGSDSEAPAPAVSVTASPAPTGPGAATEAPEPSLAPGEVPVGSPFPYESLRSAWVAQGVAVTLGAQSRGFSGFKTAPVDVTLSQAGGGSANLAVLIYASREAPADDWELVVGSRPVAKEGRVLPEHQTVWWNANVVIVVRAAQGEIAAQALEAFLGVGLSTDQ
jgi:hypothetical protein